MQTRSQAPLAAERRCRLTELPAELRNHVYSLAPSPSMPDSNDLDGFERPGILFASKTIERETLSIYKKQLKLTLEAGRRKRDSLWKGSQSTAMSIMAPVSENTKVQWEQVDLKKLVHYELRWVKEEMRRLDKEAA